LEGADERPAVSNRKSYFSLFEKKIRKVSGRAAEQTS
jgi:hypothetical protein